MTDIGLVPAAAGNLSRRGFLAGSIALGTLAARPPSVAAADGLRVAVASRFYELDPILMRSEADIALSRLIHGRLLQYDSNWQLTPQLCQEWSFGDDLRSIDFRLRGFIAFADGNRIRAEDVVRSLERVSGRSAKSYYGAQFDSVDRITVTGHDRFSISLRSPSTSVMHSLAQYFSAIVPRELESKGSFFAGSGPYVLEDWRPGEFARLRRSPVWEKTLGSRTPGPFAIEMRNIVEPRVAMRAMQAGEVDLLSLSAAQAAEVSREVLGGDAERALQPTPVIVWLGIRKQSAAGRDALIGRAISLALDVRKVVGAAYGDLADPIHSLFPAELVGGDRRAESAHSFDPARAKQLLAEAGESGGLRLTLDALRSDIDRELAALIAEQLREVGIAVTVQSLSSGDFFASQRDRSSSDMVLVRRSIGPDPSLPLRWYADRRYDAWNWEGFHSAEFAQGHERFLSSQDVEERQNILRKMEAIMVQSGQFVPLARERRATFFRRGMELTFHPDGTPNLSELRF